MRDLLALGSKIHRQEVTVDRARLTVTFGLEAAEHASRVSRGAPAVTDEALLSALMNVPADRLGPVDARQAKVLRTRCDSGVANIVEDPDGGLWAQRRIGPPIQVLSIELAASSLKRGCAAAQRWVGYGPRIVRGGRTPSAFDLTEASHYGVGYITDDGDRLLAPDPYCSRVWSSARWRFAEVVYGQFREQLG